MPGDRAHRLLCSPMRRGDLRQKWALGPRVAALTLSSGLAIVARHPALACTHLLLLLAELRGAALWRVRLDLRLPAQAAWSLRAPLHLKPLRAAWQAWQGGSPHT